MDFASRYDFLKTLIARYDSYYNLAAVKASLLLTTNAILIAPALGADSPLRASAGGATRVLIVIAIVATLVSVVFSALVIASYLKGRQSLREGHSHVFTESVAEQSSEDYVNAVATLSQAALIDDMARLANVLARGVVQRFRYVNVSLVALVIALISAFAAMLS